MNFLDYLIIAVCLALCASVTGVAFYALLALFGAEA